MAIRSFAERGAEEFFVAGRLKRSVGWRGVRRVVKRKLDMLHYADQLGDLRSPPGNRLEVLRGRLVGYYSIRVNDRWRIVFRWTDSGPMDVRVVDYH